MQMWKLIPQLYVQDGHLYTKLNVQQDTPIMSEVTVIDLPHGESVILQARSALDLPNGKYTNLSPP